MRIMILGLGTRQETQLAAPDVIRAVERAGELVAQDFTGSLDLSGVEADAVVVLGGDGSILRAARRMGEHQIPVIAVNLGRLGFLADVSPEDLPSVLEAFKQGQCRVVEHLMFRCEVFVDGERTHDFLGLNEVSIQTGPPFSMLDLDLYIDSEPVTAYSCDGLIISSPVGSTGHSLSAGGPILRKDLQAFVISPISPHTLTNRPVVDSADRVYEVVVDESSPGEAFVVVDGCVLCELNIGDRVRVARAEPKFQLVVPPGHSYYRTLREKLRWSGRVRRISESEGK